MILTEKRCALIDMDGVLYDSMKYHTLAWKQLMNELGIPAQRDEFYLHEGMTGPATINLLYQRERGMTLPEEEARRIYRRKAEIFIGYGEIPTMTGAREMLDTLRALGIDRILVTGSAQNSLLSRLDTDYPGAFAKEKRVTALDVTHGKPHPEPYLKGLEMSGCRPEEVFVIENAPLGVRAAKAAGLDCVAVMTGPIPEENFIREKADIILPDIPALTHLLKSPSC